MKITIKPVIYDEDFRTYRAASKSEVVLNDCEWALYEDGSFADCYKTKKEAEAAKQDCY